jgi:hypothetical protein
MTIRFIRDWRHMTVGRVVDFMDGVAAELVRRKIAEPCAAQACECAAVTAPENAMRPAPAPKPRRR